MLPCIWALDMLRTLLDKNAVDEEVAHAPFSKHSAHSVKQSEAANACASTTCAITTEHSCAQMCPSSFR